MVADRWSIAGNVGTIIEGLPHLGNALATPGESGLLIGAGWVEGHVFL
jgi:hypothetical protein